jgi:hypothetical protein
MYFSAIKHTNLLFYTLRLFKFYFMNFLIQRVSFVDSITKITNIFRNHIN